MQIFKSLIIPHLTGALYISFDPILSTDKTVFTCSKPENKLRYILRTKNTGKNWFKADASLHYSKTVNSVLNRSHYE